MAEIDAQATAGPAALLLGDSIIEQWRFWPKEFPGLSTLNAGISGERTDNVLARIPTAFPPGKPPVFAVLLVGTNNTGARHSAGDIAAGIAAILMRFRANLPDTRVLLLSLLPRAEDNLRPVLQEVNRLVRSCADGHAIVFLDVWSRFLDAQGSVNRSLLPDGLHPSEAGYDVLAGAIRGTLASAQ